MTEGDTLRPEGDNIHQNLKHRYWCFLSYRHADNKESGRQWATWLHQSLENYEVPSALVGTKNDRGESIPERIFPVFRDEEELPASAELSRPIQMALERSRFLVVLCSPQSVQSRWVADEIMRFKQLGKPDRILAAIIEGRPNGSDDPEKPGSNMECFPLPMQYELGEDGQLGTLRTEPIAADFRLPDGSMSWTSPMAYRAWLEGQDPALTRGQIQKEVERFNARQNLMLLKVIAGILGVQLGVLTQRDKAYRLEMERRRAKVLQRWVVTVSCLAVAALIGGALAWVKQLESEKRRKEAALERDVARSARAGADEFIHFLQDDVIPQIEASQQQSFASKINDRIQRYLDSTVIDPSDYVGAHERIQLLLSQSSMAEEQGKLGDAVKLCSAALSIVNQFLARMEADEEFKKIDGAELAIERDNVTVGQRMAAVTFKMGNHDQALRMLDVTCNNALALRKKAPQMAVFAVDYAAVEHQRGGILVKAGRETDALEAYRKSIAAYEPAVRANLLAEGIEEHAVTYAALIELAEKLAPGSGDAPLETWGKLLAEYQPAEAHVLYYLNARMFHTHAVINKLTRVKDWAALITEQERQISLLKARHAKKAYPDFIGTLFRSYNQSISLALEKLEGSQRASQLFENRIDDVTLAVKGSEDFDEVIALVIAHSLFADFLQDSEKDLKLAGSHYAKALEILELSVLLPDRSPEGITMMSQAHRNLGINARLREDFDEALKHHQQELMLAMAAQSLCHDEKPLDLEVAAECFSDVADATQHMVDVLYFMDKRKPDPHLGDQARKLVKSALESRNNLVGTDQAMADALEEVTKTLRQLYHDLGGRED